MQAEELSEHIQQKRLHQAIAAIGKARAVQAEAAVISELCADPRWERYGRHVEAEREAAQRSIQSCERRLGDIFSPLSPLDELKQKLQLAYSRGAVEAYAKALSIAKDLIEKGEVADQRIAQLTEIAKEAK